MSHAVRFVLLLGLLAAAGAQAQSSCSSDGRPQPSALLERFVDADCAACWTAADTPAARPGELALDWIVPAERGEDARLAAAARGDALERLQALRRPRPATASSVRGVRRGAVRLRVAHGLPFNGYLGASIALSTRQRGPWTAWLALVETLPAGTEGSPVERNLVRNLLQLSWDGRRRRHAESRPMNIPAGATPERLRVVGWVEDAHGVIRAISDSGCAPPGGER